jgi:hypothetical protein
MSYLDLDKLSPVDLIVQYVLECRGAGLFLPYQDYQVIEEWLASSCDADGLLLVLADVLPAFFERGAGQGRPRGLSGCHRLVLSRLKDQAMRQPAK